MNITKDIDEYGNIFYYNENKLRHREDGPAIEWANGNKEWYLNGQRHREDGPARVYADGTKSWYINGQRHREDGPAIEYVSGHKVWFLNDKRYSEQEFNDFLLKKRLQKILEL